MFVLYTFADRFVVELEGRGLTSPGSVGHASAAGDSLYIFRSTGAIQRVTAQQKQTGQVQPPVGNPLVVERIDAILGIINLLRGRYLLVITGSKHIATVQGCPIKQLKLTKLVPFVDPNSHPLTPTQERDEARYLKLLHNVLQCGSFYFSYDYDLTLNTQRIADIRTKPELSALPLWRRADDRFFWNRYLCQDLIQTSENGSSVDEWILPLMNGYIFQQHLRIKGHDVTFILMSRRSCQRAGRRFVTRGLNLEGHAANFAEQEQIIFVTDPSDVHCTRVASFVQTRGSVPIIWEQPCTLKYAPKINILKAGKETEIAFSKHFEVQLEKYGKQVCLNLVNQKGAELALVKGYKEQVDRVNNQSIRLINWDFHHECRKMKYENISKLVDMCKDDMEQMGWFCARVSSVSSGSSASTRLEWEVTRRQTGVLRTNCVDCLDRTNVVQSVFARIILDRQLKEFTGFAGMTGGEKLETLDSMFRTVWANNADAMSIQYSGTGALKTDYTRTGKRSLKGAFMDGVNSVTRYYLNNFEDGRNQDSLDLFLGLYRPATTQPSPFEEARYPKAPSHQRSVTSWMLRFSFVFFLSLFCLHVLVPTESPYASYLTPLRNYDLQTQFWVYGLLDLAIGWKVMMKQGRQYANKPVLRTNQL